MGWFLVLGVCSSVCLHTVIGAVAGLRLLPTIVNLVRFLIRWLLVCSFRLYRLMLKLLTPFAKRHLRLDLDHWAARLVACAVLSVSLMLLIIVVLQLGFNIWLVSGAVLHGLIVSLLWDDLAQPSELHLGIRLL